MAAPLLTRSLGEVALPWSTFSATVAFTSGLAVIYCLTAAIPSALSVVNALNETQATQLAESGQLVGSTSIGLAVGAATVVALPSWYAASRWPYLVMCLFMIIGGLLYYVALGEAWPLFTLLLARSVMTLGGGALYSCKRLCGGEPDERRRKLLFMLLELGSTTGMAGGPLLGGLIGLSIGSDEAPSWWVPLSIAGLAALLLPIYLFWPLQQPLDQCCLLRAKDAGKQQQQQQQPPPRSGHVAIEEAAVGTARTSACCFAPVGEKSELLPRKAEASPTAGSRPLWASAVVQVTCICYGISRLFLKFGFESAMVVVYNRQYGWTNSTSAVVAGGIALCSVGAIFGYALFCANRLPERHLLLLSDGLGYSAAVTMILMQFVDLQAMLFLTFFASILFYPCMYLAGALCNAHPLSYVQPESRWLSRSGMVAQQEIIQTPIGTGLGMLLSRVALVDPGTDAVQLARLGWLFLGVMALQSLVVHMGWEPERTARLLDRARKSVSLVRWPWLQPGPSFFEQV